MLELEGLPATRDGVRLRAKREGWSCIDRPGRGGGRMYAVVDLPAEARQDITDRIASMPSNLRPVGRPKGTDFFTKNPDVAAAVESYVIGRDLAVPRVMELLSTGFDVLPSRRTLARHIAKLQASKPALIASIQNPDEFNSRHRLALGRADASVSYAHQVWEIDTTKADVLTHEGRRSIIGIVDVFSRRARYLVVPSESAQSVRRALITTIIAWGVMPEVLRTDQGSGFINASIKSALPPLGIHLDPCPPGSPEKKPHVERLFGTFTRERATMLAGFIGHNVADAQALRAKARKESGRAVIVPEMSETELQAVIDAWIDGVYHQRRHSTLGMTPMQRWMTSPRPAAAAPDEGILKLALSAFVGSAVVGKRGVQWKGGRYWTAELAAFVGRPVAVRRDEEDLGALFIFDEDSHYIGTAIDAARSGLSEQAFAMEARRQQDEYMKAAKADFRKKSSRFKYEDARDQLLRRDAEAAGKLTALPVPTRDRATPLLERRESETAVGPSAASIEAADRIVEAARRAPAPKTLAERIADTDRVLADHAAGIAVTPEALAAARIFASSSDYRAAKIVQANFAPRSVPADTPLATMEKRQ